MVCDSEAMNDRLIQAVRTDVFMLLGDDTDGHGKDHIQVVYDMAMKFAKDTDADLDVVALAALLHDVDDYKLVGKEAADNLRNTRALLAKHGVDQELARQVVDIVSSMGYSRLLEGIRPQTLEGKIVSDADMCDSIGARGILRTHAYNLSAGRVFFDKTAQPVGAESDAAAYRDAKTGHSVQHFFDKLLKIPLLLMTEAGKEEGAKRQTIMIAFLNELFREEDTPVWQKHLKDHR